MMNQYVKYPDSGSDFSDNLIVALENNDLQGAEVINYPRYWHGYLIILKPIMVLLNYQQLRIVNFILQVSTGLREIKS